MKIKTAINTRTVPIFLLVISILGFGLLIPKMRFNWDDWAKILVARLWGLKAPTAIFTENEPFPNQGLFSISAALNLVYPQPQGWGSPVDNSAGSSQKTAPANHRDAYNPFLPTLVKAFLPISNLSQIPSTSPQPGYPPKDILGPKPAQSWRAYFEKADLARQNQQWGQVATLYDAAQQSGFTLNKSGSNSPYEWLPFIDGLGNARLLDEAVDLSNQVVKRESKLRDMLCQMWEEDFASLKTDQTTQVTVEQERQRLGCK